MTRFAVVFLLLAPAVRADVRDPAALFPADAPAFAELARPADVAAAVAALLADSPLADSLPFTHDRLDAEPDGQKHPGIRAAGRWGLLLSPELLGELKRVRGAAVGLTGFTTKGHPRVAAAVLLGDTPALGLAVRAFLTTTPNVRRVGAADGVPVFQFRGVVGPLADPNTGQPLGPDDEDNPLRGRKPLPGEGEPTFAYLPGLFVVGSDGDAVADVIRRFHGKEPSPALASDPAFRTAAERDLPGVFFHLRPPALLAKWDAARKAAELGGEPDAAAWLRFALNPWAVRRIVGNLRVTPDAVGLTADADRDPGTACPLLDLLAGPAVPPNAVRFARPDAAWSVAFTLPPDRRAAVVLALADACAKANGTVGALPSERTAPGLPGLLTSTAAVTVFDPTTPTAWPVVVVHADDDGTAGKWVDAVPRWFAEEAGKPSAETVGGVRVLAVAADAVPGGRVYFARAGRSVVFAADQMLAASTARRVEQKDSPPTDAVAVGRVRLGTLLAPGPSSAATPAAPDRPNVLPVPGTPAPAAVSFAGLAKAADHLPPLAVAVLRRPDGVRVEAWLRDLPKPVGRAVRDGLKWAETIPVPGAADGGPIPVEGFPLPPGR